MIAVETPSAVVKVPPNPTERLDLAYFNRGYETGYKQAVNDLLAALVPLSETFIDAHPKRADELRKLLYPFEAYLEQRISQMSPDHEYVEGGLGI